MNFEVRFEKYDVLHGLMEGSIKETEQMESYTDSEYIQLQKEKRDLESGKKEKRIRWIVAH